VPRRQERNSILRPLIRISTAHAVGSAAGTIHDAYAVSLVSGGLSRAAKLITCQSDEAFAAHVDRRSTRILWRYQQVWSGTPPTLIPGMEVNLI
jgi:hypothetical protein